MIKKWIKKKLGSLLNEHDEDIGASMKLSRPVMEYGTTPGADPILSFKIYNATGGKIVEFNSYDRKTDRAHNELYIITDEEDFGPAIMNIAVTHRLRTGL
jgi:hypothetical protein